MAYYQPTDPYYQPSDNYHSGNTGVALDHPSQDYGRQYSQNHNNYDDGQSLKSYQSGYAGSQAHLNPQYEMSQVSVHNNGPPVPSLPYGYQQNYPPQQLLRPGMRRDMSTGYSMAREKLLKRRSMRQVELVNGNLVIDVQVPSHITPKGLSDVEEMCKMRYTAATCDPDEFMRMKYSLRPYLYGRHTELFIVMTMYNEDEVLFVKTMNA